MDLLNNYGKYAHWLVRLSLASIFLYHGFGKFPMAEMMAAGMGMPIAMIYLLGTMEFLGGLLILWGGIGPDWATRVAGAIFTMVMAGAVVMVHAANGWSFMAKNGMEGSNNMGGMEFQVFVMAVSLFFVFKGNSVSEVNS